MVEQKSIDRLKEIKQEMEKLSAEKDILESEIIKGCEDALANDNLKFEIGFMRALMASLIFSESPFASFSPITSSLSAMPNISQIYCLFDEFLVSLQFIGCIYDSPCTIMNCLQNNIFVRSQDIGSIFQTLPLSGNDFFYKDRIGSVLIRSIFKPVASQIVRDLADHIFFLTAQKTISLYICKAPLSIGQIHNT